MYVCIFLVLFPKFGQKIRYIIVLFLEGKLRQRRLLIFFCF